MVHKKRRSLQRVDRAISVLGRVRDHGQFVVVMLAQRPEVVREGTHVDGGGRAVDTAVPLARGRAAVGVLVRSRGGEEVVVATASVHVRGQIRSVAQGGPTFRNCSRGCVASASAPTGLASYKKMGNILC